MGAGTATRVIRGLEELEAAVGQELGASSWLTVGQDEIDAFARATGDDYWIHTDPERAGRSPLGGTIAHGLLTLSLGPRLMYEVVAFEGFAVSMNLGYDRVRFPAPLPAGSRVRMRAALTAVRLGDGGARVSLTQTFEREGADRPVCVAEFLLHLGA
jgi:acyl dehydratase